MTRRAADLIALRASESEPRVVEWVDRRAGSIDIDTASTTTLATVDVSITGAQRGLLGHTVIDGIRYASWTEPEPAPSWIGSCRTQGVGRRGTDGGAVGRHLATSADDQLILGIGQLTEWARDHGSGALLQLDPLGPAEQEPSVLSSGSTNPFAFAVTDGLDEPALDGQLWVADNAVGDDVERIGRADPGSAFADRDSHPPTDADTSAESSDVLDL